MRVARQLRHIRTGGAGGQGGSGERSGGVRPWVASAPGTDVLMTVHGFSMYQIAGTYAGRRAVRWGDAAYIEKRIQRGRVIRKSLNELRQA